MSIEFKSHFDSPLRADVIQEVRHALVRDGGYTSVRESGDEVGLQSGDASSTEEHVTLLLQADRCYVAFHVADRSQRNAFLSFCQDTFAKAGVHCEFEEL